MNAADTSGGTSRKFPTTVVVVVVVAALVVVGLVAALVPRADTPRRKVEIVRDSQGRLVEVTSLIDSSETDVELKGGMVIFHGGPLAAWKAVPIKHRLVVEEKGATYTTTLGEAATFPQGAEGVYASPAASPLKLAQSNGEVVLTDSAGLKHYFSVHSPFPTRVVAASGSQLFLTFKPDGALIRLQSSERGSYSFSWSENGLLACVLDEAGRMWEYHYEGLALARITTSRPIEGK